MSMQNRADDRGIRLIPLASMAHCAAVGEMLERLSAEFGLSEKSKRQREGLVEYLSELFRRNQIDVKVELFGSSAHGIGFEDSDVNINVQTELEEEKGWNGGTSDKISKVIDVCMADPHLRDVKVKADSQPHRLQIQFSTDRVGSHIPCRIYFNNTGGVKLANLFQEFCKANLTTYGLAFALRYWARVLGIDDQEKGMLAAHGYIILAINYLQALKQTPILQEKLELTELQLAGMKGICKAEHKGYPKLPYHVADLGHHWMHMIYYYSYNENFKSQAICISRYHPHTIDKKDKIWNRMLSIEDPIVWGSNLSRSIATLAGCEYIIQRFPPLFAYFAVPRTKIGPIYDAVCDDKRYILGKNVYYRFLLCSKRNDTQIKLVDQQDRTCNWSTEEWRELACLTMARNAGRGKANVILQSQTKLADSCISKELYHYEFVKEILMEGTKPPAGCNICGVCDHVRRNCPQVTLPPLDRVEKPDNRTLQLLGAVIESNYEKERLNEEDFEHRKAVKRDIQTVLHKGLEEVVEVCSFGSSENGFGVKQSDLDLCIILKRLPVTENNEEKIRRCKQELDVILYAFDKFPRLVAEVVAIKSAKVPIVKFVHWPTKLECDISFYNTLAIRNTKLLQAYTSVDKRLPIIGCFLKKLGKLTEIGDSSKGSLSSYAFILMLVHYLQQTDPPVLPVLQEVPPIGHDLNEPLPTFMVDNWNTYFFEDIRRLGEVWKAANTTPVEELWIGFLEYYTTFDYENFVISISHRNPLTRKNKVWYTNCLAIEDPFEKIHNLGSSLSLRMHTHIIRTLRQFRRVFNITLNTEDMTVIRTWYFDEKNLKAGELPIERQCRLCHKIGHIARYCSANANSAAKEDRDDHIGASDRDEYKALVDRLANQISLLSGGPRTPCEPVPVTPVLESKRRLEQVLMGMMPQQQRPVVLSVSTPQQTPSSPLFLNSNQQAFHLPVGFPHDQPPHPLLLAFQPPRPTAMTVASQTPGVSTTSFPHTFTAETTHRPPPYCNPQPQENSTMFLNMNPPDNTGDHHLLRMIQSTAGVSFSPFEVDRARRFGKTLQQSDENHCRVNMDMDPQSAGVKTIQNTGDRTHSMGFPYGGAVSFVGNRFPTINPPPGLGLRPAFFHDPRMTMCFPRGFPNGTGR